MMLKMLKLLVLMICAFVVISLTVILVLLPFQHDVGKMGWVVNGMVLLMGAAVSWKILTKLKEVADEPCIK